MNSAFLAASLLSVAVGVPDDAADAVVIGLIGDSTVATTYGWGPAFAERFDDRTTVLNYARNGARLDTLSERLDELLAKSPDYVLIQFGHNDQKKYGPDAYREKLTDYVRRVKAAGAQPVVLSSVTRRNFGPDGKILPRTEGLRGGLPAFAEAAGAVAQEEVVPFINLYGISVDHHNRLGPEATAAYDFDPTDQTHFSPAGAAATAGLIVDELKVARPELARRLKRTP
ncbi:GDSL-type esterase/lipase family protein [Alienimonas californiensis]|uniref:Rhamnogalacturonan acetylesterase RhgT n=1 Tax=Alienimonas californiensis TaxID=2527989 RepID=A0A517P842_9PLAN|nr:GDSL-type esterase/lipase family protein [Alienimonas californiensis]QDT15515.1 Rhamnogalacturonan acetylesterase RhgT [Alienimonas californiensis]